LSCLRNTTLLPMKRPASRISTVPGVMVDLHKRMSDSDQNEHEHHEGCHLQGAMGHLSLVGLGLRVLGTRGLTSSAG